jgi:uncharacterized membrane protein
MADGLTAYGALKFIHVLLAIVAVGANATYGIWIARASRRPEILPGVLRTIKFLDDRVANPSYGFLLLTGLGLVWLGDWPLRTPWIATALVLFAVMALLGVGLYTPALRKQIDALERHGFQSAAYRHAATRGTAFGIATSVPAVLIVAVMVLKPG